MNVIMLKVILLNVFCHSDECNHAEDHFFYMSFYWMLFYRMPFWWNPFESMPFFIILFWWMALWWLLIFWMSWRYLDHYLTDLRTKISFLLISKRVFYFHTNLRDKIFQRHHGWMKIAWSARQCFSDQYGPILKIATHSMHLCVI